jgi:NAD(P)-dependent dehydrogenase (short-subunit alcohol dehydrogenase family)
MTGVLVTGASRGIGKYIATHFAQKGYDVAITSIDEAELEATVTELRDLPESGTVLSHVADSADESVVEAVVTETAEEFGGIDILVNNAGRVGPTGEFHTNDLTDWKRTVRTNLFGMVHYTYFTLPIMLKAGYGRIINILGGGARSSRPTLSGYGTSKAATLRFTTSVGEELAGTDVTMNGVGPGVVDTQLIAEIINGDGISDAYEQKLSNKIENGTTTDPSKLCRFVEYLARDDIDTTGGIREVDEWDDPKAE